jgi:hypothetical protein
MGLIKDINYPKEHELNGITGQRAKGKQGSKDQRGLNNQRGVGPNQLIEILTKDIRRWG